MAGFEIFIFIAIGVALLLVISSFILQTWLPEKKNRFLRLGFWGLLVISLVIFIFSFYVGGWDGMGYGFMAISILIGTLLGGLINSLTNSVIRINNK